MNLLYIAQFHETCGYSHAAIGYFKSMLSVLKEYEEVNLKILSIALDPRKLNRNFHKNKTNSDVLDLLDEYCFKSQEEFDHFLAEDYDCVWHMTSCLPLIAKKVNLPKGNFYKNIKANLEKTIRGSKSNYHILAWETDQLPEEYIEAIKCFQPQNIFAPSTWNAEVFGKDYSSEYLPHLIEQENKKSEKVSLPKGYEDKFKILSVSEWTNRKNFQCLIKSFIAEFGTNEDAMLILKLSLPGEMQKDEFLKQFRKIKNSVRVRGEIKQNIVVILDYLSKEKMNFLYEICDAFCLTSFGEGFSLPTSEAVILGKPVICPKLGGHTDYISKDNPFFIEGYWDSVFDSPPYDSDGNWFVPTIKSTRENLKLAYEDFKKSKELLRSSVQKNKETILSGKFSRESIGHKFFKNVLVQKNKQLEKNEVLKNKIINLNLQEQINALANSYKGEDCYILNCGPSLNDYDQDRLKHFLKDKLVFTVKQAQDLYSEVSDFHFFNCSNLPKRESIFEPHYKVSKKCITVASSNYPESTRWPSNQLTDIFFKVPIRTEINNEFLVRTGKINDFLLNNNLTRPCGPGIMYETVLFMAIHLGVKSITCIGWDLTKDKVNENTYNHFYGSTSDLVNRGDILDWEIKETREFSKNFYEWCIENGIKLNLAPNRSSLYEDIPRIKLEI